MGEPAPKALLKTCAFKNRSLLTSLALLSKTARGPRSRCFSGRSAEFGESALNVSARVISNSP